MEKIRQTSYTAKTTLGEQMSTFGEYASDIRDGVQDKWALFRELTKPDGKRIAVLEGNQDCNRSCSYCAVPDQYNSATELTLQESFQAIDLLRGQNFRLLSYLGGEPFAPFKTKEGITFTEHSLGVVRYASEQGMVVNVTTNGDYIPKQPGVIKELKDAGLDSLTFSLHTFTRRGLERLMLGAHMAAEQGIIPTIQTVMTRETTPLLPGIAAYAARNGILFSTGIVQTEGDGFAREQDDSVIPTREQQELTFAALRALKRFGFVRTGATYLKEATDFYPNSWVCDPERDTFIKIGAGGKVDVCSRVKTGLEIADLAATGLDDERWRAEKEAGVAMCEAEEGGCLYNCYRDAQEYHRALLHEVPTGLVMLAIKNGKIDVVKRLGRVAAGRSESQVPQVDWSLSLPA